MNVQHPQSTVNKCLPVRLQHIRITFFQSKSMEDSWVVKPDNQKFKQFEVLRIQLLHLLEQNL